MCFGETVPDSLPVTDRIIETNGVRLRTVEAGEPGAPVVVLAHGFPELAYSWRHQIPVLAAAGYHVLAPDQRGYGGSSRPDDVAAYNVADLSADVIGLLDDVGAERAVLIGHDWGAPVVWGSAQLHPDRVAAVVGLSVPPVPRAQIPPTQAFRMLFGDNFFYMLYFQEPGVADAELAADPAKTLRRMIGGLRASGDPADAVRMIAPGSEGFIERLPEPDGLPSWISADELDHYVAEFTPHRFHRRAELVSEHGPQLGAVGRPTGRHHLGAGAVRRRHRRSGGGLHAPRPHRRVGDRSVQRGDDRGRRTLAATGVP